MHYYQYDGLLRDGQRKEHITYLLKSSTRFRGKDIAECLQFQQAYLHTVLKFDSLLVNKLTSISEPEAKVKMAELGKSLNHIPKVDFCDLAPGLHK